MISIIIRTKNEENWIGHCLKSIFLQNCKDFEVILVDNESIDNTLAIAKTFPIKKIVTVTKYTPGLALNQGIKHSTGETLVIISGHCIPTNNNWLGNLVKGLEDNSIAGVYGRQEPMPFSSDFDKRDLLITFGLDKRVQKKDSFFHNANSALKKKTWEMEPFDEELTNIEDRAWAQKMISQGYSILYEPEASVFHHHGIHQNQDQKRCQQIVRILETLNLVPAKQSETQEISPSASLLQFKITSKDEENFIDVLIPFRGNEIQFGKIGLVENCIRQVKSCHSIRKVFVLTDNPEVAQIATSQGCLVPYIRDHESTSLMLDILSALSDAIKRIEHLGIELTSDLLVAYPTKPFRDELFFKELITSHFREKQIQNKKNLTTIPCLKEHETFWTQDTQTHNLTQVDQGLVPREFKTPTYISQIGLGFIASKEDLIQNTSLASDINLYVCHQQHYKIEVRNQNDALVIQSYLSGYFS